MRRTATIWGRFAAFCNDVGSLCCVLHEVGVKIDTIVKIVKIDKNDNTDMAECLAEIGDFGAAIGYLETASDRLAHKVSGGRAGNLVDRTPTGVTRSLIPGLRQHCARVRPAGPGYR